MDLRLFIRKSCSFSSLVKNEIVGSFSLVDITTCTKNFS